MSEVETRYLVLGAGISGLSFADWTRSRDYILCEAEHEIGGYCRTVERNGFVWDYSGHFFHFRHPDLERYLVQRMGAGQVRRVVKRAKVYWKGDLIDFPFQKNIHQLPREDFLACLTDLYFRDKEARPSNFKDMLYSKFGAAISDFFLVPYNEKLYATDLARLDVDAMGRFFPHADLDAIMQHFRAPDHDSYNASFTYPEKGAVQYVRAIAQGVDASRIWLEEAVTRVELAERRATTVSGRVVHYQHLISSAPFPKLLSLAGIPTEDGDYTWNKVLVFNLGFDRKGPAGVHWIYYPQRDVVFYRVGFYDNILGADRMSLYVEIGFHREARIDEARIETLRRRVLDDLAKSGIVDGHRLVASHHVVLDPAYVHISRESVARVASAKAELEAHEVYSLGRYGSWTYCSIEDNMVEARALAEKLDAKSKGRG